MKRGPSWQLLSDTDGKFHVDGPLVLVCRKHGEDQSKLRSQSSTKKNTKHILPAAMQNTWKKNAIYHLQ